MSVSLSALLLAVVCILCSSDADDSEAVIVWNTDGQIRRLDDLFEPYSAQRVVVFLLPEFSLASFTQQLNAYLPNGDGGKLRHFKNLLQRFRSSTVLNGQQLNWKMLQRPSFYHVPYDEVDSADDWKSHDRVLLTIDSWRHLDKLASKLVENGVMETRIGILASPPVARQKRAAARASPSFSFVNVSNGHCLLYASRISFVVNEVENGRASLTEYDLPADKLTGSGNCGNYAGNIVLRWSPFAVEKGLLKDVHIGLEFDRFAQQWYLANLTLSAAGSLIKDGNVEHFFDYDQVHWMQVAGAPEFCFACSRPKMLIMPYDKEAPTKTRYGIAFRNLQLQPFLPKGQNVPGFTTAVDDCAEFFSIPIWMGLISVGIVFLITMFGVGMISNLRTMDRFDDPRGKALVINAKD